MKKFHFKSLGWMRTGTSLSWLGWMVCFESLAQLAPVLSLTSISATGEVSIQTQVNVNRSYVMETSTDLKAWTPHRSWAAGAASILHEVPMMADSDQRFFRMRQWETAPVLFGDYLSTTQGDAIIHPINHATFVLHWNDVSIYVDPVGGGSLFAGLPTPDLILITHSHGDHFDTSTLNAVVSGDTQLVTPLNARSQLPRGLQAMTTAMSNGETIEVLGAKIEAVPAYNSRHTKGEGNGYVLELGGKRIYVSGDTEDVPEMRALHQIDIAFVCMNLPFTMSVEQAASAVREFQPAVVYPYHHRNSDVVHFKFLVGTDLPIEVRLRDWY